MRRGHGSRAQQQQTNTLPVLGQQTLETVERASLEISTTDVVCRTLRFHIEGKATPGVSAQRHTKKSRIDTIPACHRKRGQKNTPKSVVRARLCERSVSTWSFALDQVA